MKKLILLSFALCLFAAPAVAVHAQTAGYVTPSQGKNPNIFCQDDNKGSSACTYVPLEPLPFLTNKYGPESGSIGTFIGQGFKLIIGAGAVIAVAIIVLGALTYMFSDVAGNKKDALARIRNGMWGIVILLSSYLILYTINPELVTFNLKLTPLNNYNTTPGSSSGGTRVIVTNPSGVNIYNGPDAYEQRAAEEAKCASPKSLHATGRDTDSRGEYVTYTCM